MSPCSTAAFEMVTDQRREGGGKIKGSVKPGGGGASVTSSAPSSTGGDKWCGVCGDRALGCNFDAVSCESCKAFFRRNALKNKLVKCLFEGACKIDVNTRRFCPHCRLMKCFTIGMRKDLILGDDEKRKRLERVHKNRTTTTSSGDEETSSTKPSVRRTTTNKPCRITSTSTKEISPTEQPQPIMGESFTPPSTPHRVQPTVITVPSVAAPHRGTISHRGSSSAEQIVLHVLQPNGRGEAIQVHPDLLSALSQVGHMGEGGEERTVRTGEERGSEQGQVELFIRQLNAEEDRQLQELVQVYDLSFTVDLEPLVHIKQLDPSLNQLVNQSSITVLRLIKFAKRLEQFALLPQLCQIGILKGCWIPILILRSVSVYDSERDVWVTPRGDIPTEILKNATGFVRLHDDHVRYCKSIKSIIGDDLAIVVILLAIVLFSPEGPHVVARELVSNIQDRYVLLLKHYLESKYTYARSADMFPALMSKVKELKDFAELHGRCLVDINPSEIEPIMLEILDLK